MHAQPEFGFKELFTHIIGGIARALCERNGEPRQQQFFRSQAATAMVLNFMPRDRIEAMLAGHCVMFHELMVDSVHGTLQGEMDTMRLATRKNITALNTAFMNNLDRFEHYQCRPSDGRRDVPEADAHAAETAPQATVSPEPPIAEPPIAEPPIPEPPIPEPPTAVSGASTGPSPEAIAACKANPEAMAALDAGDAAAFARALGIEQPNEAYVAAASSQMAAFNRHGSREHLPVANRSGANPEAGRNGAKPNGGARTSASG